MKRNSYRSLVLAVGLVVFFSCRKMDVYNGANSTLADIYTDLAGPLQSLTDVPIGFGIGYTLMRDNTNYRNTVATEASSVTFEYEMKHGAIVQGDGSLDFSRADALLALSKDAGLTVFGHTLVWHQNQNAAYLYSLTGGSGPAAQNLIANGGFDDELAGWTPVNTGNPAGSSTFEVTNVPSEVRSGNALKVVTDQSYGDSQWRVQIHTSQFSAQAGRTYEVSFWIRAANPGGSIRLSLSPDQNAESAYQGDQNVGTEWTQITWEVTMTGDQQSRISFDAGRAANTYFIDDVRVVDTAPVVTNLVLNPGFEDDLTGWTPVNTGNPAGSSTFTITDVPAEVRGTKALKVVTDQDYGGSQWRVQIHTNEFPTEAGETYNVSFWIRAANPGGSIRLSASPDQNVADPGPYQGDQNVGTDWTQITWTFTKTTAQPTKISFDIGAVANTYFIDDVIVRAASSGGGGGGDDEEIRERVGGALRDFITQTVTHFKDDVKAWDVVNEALNDNGSFRAGPFDPENEGDDIFYWGQFLGRDYIGNAFTYAHEADPEALLFINDYNLENPTKVDALIALVDELRAEGVPIHGIGTQMHCGINTSFANIDAMFRKLAATGLQIRISELDVRLNPGNAKQGSVNDRKTLLNLQAHMYHYVVSSYLKHVPPAQQHGITIWNVTDADSWIVVNQGNNDAPLLYDQDFNKKPAYGGVVKALKEGR